MRKTPIFNARIPLLRRGWGGKKMKTYTLTRTCKCGDIQEFEHTKVEMAFKLFGNRYYKIPCPKCGDTAFDSIGYETPEMDDELFQIWSENEAYQFLEQDEDLLLAEMENLQRLLGAFDDENFPKNKKTIVANALCTLLFDNTPLSENEDDYTAEERQQMQKNRAEILPKLQQRKDKILLYKNAIWDYIWKAIETDFK